MKSRKKAPSIKTLKRKLWNELSKYIKLRDSHIENGKIYVICVTCGNKYELGDRRINAGHFFSSKRSPAIRYNEYNIHAQCASCNLNQGEQYIMYKYIKQKYGQRIVDRLEALKDESYKFTKGKIQKYYEQYIRKNKKLEEDISSKLEEG